MVRGALIAVAGVVSGALIAVAGVVRGSFDCSRWSGEGEL